MITSKLTSKAQTVIPQAVREHLKIGPGDEVEYELLEGAAVIRPSRTRAAKGEDPFALFDEWAGENDQRAYDGL